MKTISVLLIISSFFVGVFGDELRSVMEGQSVTLHTDTKLQTDDLIDWRFGDEKILIADNNKIYPVPDGRFRDRLQVDHQTGSLTITNITTQHTGLYQLKISGQKITIKTFILSVFGADESVSVMIGDSVTLHTHTELQSQEVIEWRFGDGKDPIAKLNSPAIVSLFNGTDGRFRDRLKLNSQTGDLTITDIKSEHTGVYQLIIIRGKATTKITFNVSSVISADEVKSVSVMNGDTVTLHTDVNDIRNYDVIRWRFQHGNSPLAELNRQKCSKSEISECYHVHDERLRNRLKLDLSGSLIITNISTTDTGVYDVDMRSRGRHTIHKSFTVTLSGEVKSMSVTEGESVTLDIDNIEIQTYDLTRWLFGDKAIQIAEMYKAENQFLTYDGPNERFKDRLKLNDQTGSLTISNIGYEHTGQYDVKISSNRRSVHRKFIVTVSAPAQSSGVTVGICVTLLVVAAAAAAAVFYYHRKYSKVKKQMDMMSAVQVGESVNLPTDLTDMPPNCEIIWMFEPQDTGLANKFKVQRNFIATIKRTNSSIQDDIKVLDERFRDRLELSRQTGDLTITNIRTTDSGLYRIKKICNGKKSSMKFHVHVFDEVKKVNNGESISLHTGLQTAEIDMIEWRFGDKNSLIAQIDPALVDRTFDGDDGLFRDVLKLNHQTGDLTINNIRQKHSGVYELKIISGGPTLYKTLYRVIVNEYKRSNKSEDIVLPLINEENEQL